MAEEFTRGTDSSTGEDLVSRHIRRYQYLLDGQKIWANEWQELADYVLPRKNSILVRKVPGQKRTQKLFDSTAIRASEMLAASMHGTLTPSWLRWFFIETEDDDLNAIQSVAEWLDKTGLILLNEFNKSNFSSEVHECYLDLCVFAVAALFFDEAPVLANGQFGGFQFSSVPIARYVVNEGPDGLINVFYRTWNMSADSIRERWKDTAPQEYLDSLDPDKPYDVIQAITPRIGAGKSEHKWDSCWFLYRTRHILSTAGYFEFPVMVPRWSKLNGEIYGRGPSHTAIPDIRSLNKIKELELKATAKTIDPPMKQLAGDVVGPIRLVPGGFTTVRNMEGLAPLLEGIDFKVSNLKSEELKQGIRQIYYSDQLQLQGEGPQMTAEEVRVRYELMQRILGPALGRFEKEFLNPLIDRAFEILRRNNLLPDLPVEMQQALQSGSLRLRVRYEGPLARAQKSVNISSYQALINVMAPLIQAHPQVMDVVDWDEVVRDAATTLGLSPKAIRDAEKVNEVRQQNIQAQQQAQAGPQMADDAQKAAPMVKALGAAPEPGSPMSRMNGQAQPPPSGNPNAQ